MNKLNKFLLGLLIVALFPSSCKPVNPDPNGYLDGRPIVVPSLAISGEVATANVSYGICFHDHRPYSAEGGFQWVQPVLDYCRSLEPNWPNYVYVVY